MKPIIHIALILTLIFFSGPAVVSAAPIYNKSDVLAWPDLPTDPIYDQSGNPATDPATRIYSNNAGSCKTFFPVLAPDGHHLTLGEWNKVKGSAEFQCGTNGTQVSLHLTGLIPNGVYTMWNGNFVPPGMTPNFANYVGEGALGEPEGSQNLIVASAEGTAEFSVFHPAGDLGEAGTLSGPCLLDEFEFVLWGAYHVDGERGGRRPGDYCTFTTQFGVDVVRSIARVWDEEILSGIRLDTPHPPVHARNLFHLSIAMYDAWAAYDPAAVGYLFREKHTAGDVAAARREAISYAAYRILTERYALSIRSNITLTALGGRMQGLSYDTNNLSRDTSTPAGVGNAVAAMVSSYFINDAALQTNNYKDATYASVNPFLDVGAHGVSSVISQVDPNRFQPLHITNAVDQHGNSVPTNQKFLGSQWLGVRAFALARDDATKSWYDPGPPPQLGGAGDAEYRSNVVEVIRFSSQLTNDSATVDLSPRASGNNTLGANDGQGYPVNPATGQAYPANVVKRGDFARVLAEYWADGPSSETPPGHWNVIANDLADDPSFVKRLAGTGPVLDDLEWDVKVYFALNAAVHDAACAAWSLKRQYDGWRPIQAIRYMGQLGQSTDPSAPAYDPNGLPLVTNLIEVVTAATVQPGGRHQGLPRDSIAILAWPGQPNDPTNDYSGVRWIRAVDWMPYQMRTFVTPAFPGYVSGHSTFSRAAAETLAAITGSAYFPGGLASHTVSSLGFELGPSKPVELQWATYYDAADQAGLSRIYGGIHVPVDDFAGRIVGSKVGKAAWALAQQYFDGSVAHTPVRLTLRPLDSTQTELRYTTLRGLFYKVQTTLSLSDPFTDDPAGFVQALDSSISNLNSLSAPAKFYRVISALSR